jgi:hypothetical protein
MKKKFLSGSARNKIKEGIIVRLVKMGLIRVGG